MVTKLCIFAVLLLFCNLVFSEGYYNNYQYNGYNHQRSINQKYNERIHQENYRMQRNLQREAYETGRLAPKDMIDIYNLKQGYGYDGGVSDYYKPYSGY